MIPFIDLHTPYMEMEDEVLARVRDVLRSGRFIMGEAVAELEGRLAAYAGVKHCVSCASGTDALLMNLLAVGVGPGDVVVTTPFTFVATAEVVALLGAVPVFVDIDEATYNMDPEALAWCLKALDSGDTALHPLPRGVNVAGKRAKAVIAVDLFGLAADYDRINAIASAHGVEVVEDAAQSFGGVYKGRRTCSLARQAATSFFPAKPLGCYGDGGAVFTDDDELADTLRSIRVHGMGHDKYENVRVGINGRMDTLQAAILNVKLSRFPAELERRQALAAAYAEGLAGAPGLVLPTVPRGMTSAWAQYSIRVPARDAVMAALKAKGVPTAIYYPKPLHLQSAFAGLGYAAGDMPVSEACAANIFSIPFHPYMDDATRELIVSAVRGAL